ncbi:MAG: DnaD domain protein [Solobacterium sp.]|nr:DnaD domain protein [Solobacterium sp.]
MSLKAKDVYRVETGLNLGEDALSSLITLYLPIIGKDAVLLYLLLHSEGRLQRTQESHSRLCDLLGMRVEEIEAARIHLEEYLLLRCYEQEGETRNSYIYHLNAPLPSESFLSSREFYAMYVHAAGAKQAEASAAKFFSGAIPTGGFRDITSAVRRLPSERDVEAAVSFQKVSPKYAFSRDDIDINFDYEKFFATTTDVVFPNILRTRSNLEEIGRLATLYGLSADRMRILVGHCVTLNPVSLDLERLRHAASSAVPDVTTAKDPYALPPGSFLMAKQNGALVSQADKKILDRLSSEMHFSNEVINIMIEYILKISDNRLNSRFVDMVAGEWARDGVKTREDALAETQKKKISGRKKQDVLPSYYNADPGRTSDARPASAEEVEAARRILKQSGKGNEHG